MIRIFVTGGTFDETYDEDSQLIPQVIEEVYNSKRLHSAVVYLPPTEYEMTIQSTTQIAGRPSLKSR